MLDFAAKWVYSHKHTNEIYEGTNKYMNTIAITELPVNVQERVRSTLTAYDEAIVERRNGVFTNIGGHCLSADTKPADFAVFTFKKDDVYTKEEQAANRTKFLEDSKGMDWEWFGQ